LPSITRKTKPSETKQPKVKISFRLASLLVYTIGVKCRGINKKEAYAPEHVFSLSETIANKMLKESMVDLIKHTRSHIVRIYPKGLRLNSSNYEPHRFWSAGAQLVAINWQTFGM
jgi:phosphatidylinositol phospholipase C delta